MIPVELNGKTRLISIEEWLERDIQDILADDYGIDEDPVGDFHLGYIEIQIDESS